MPRREEMMQTSLDERNKSTPRRLSLEIAQTINSLFSASENAPLSVEISSSAAVFVRSTLVGVC